jgi:hypothetical protein
MARLNSLSEVIVYESGVSMGIIVKLDNCLAGAANSSYTQYRVIMITGMVEKMRRVDPRYVFRNGVTHRGSMTAVGLN